MEKITSNRNYGIDLLRIVSMFFVVVLHCLKHGGLLKATNSGTVQYNVLWFIEIFAFCAVDVFALISGYVSYKEEERKFKLSSYIKLWFHVVFYGVSISIIFNLLGICPFSKYNYYECLFPVQNKLYWYFTAYTALFFFMPFIDAAIRKIDNNTLKKYFVILLLLFPIFDFVFERFFLNYGYSFLWIFVLYILGAIMKKCEIGKNLKIYKAVLIIAVMVVLTWIYHVLNIKISFLNISIATFTEYTSFTILVIAIMYIIIFSKLKFNKTINKVISFGATSAFSIYLINDHFMLRDNAIRDRFVFLLDYPIPVMIGIIILFSLLFVVGSIFIDKIRIGLFKLIKIDIIANKIENLFDWILNKVCKIL